MPGRVLAASVPPVSNEAITSVSCAKSSMQDKKAALVPKTCVTTSKSTLNEQINKKAPNNFLRKFCTTNKAENSFAKSVMDQYFTNNPIDDVEYPSSEENINSDVEADYNKEQNVDKFQTATKIINNKRQSCKSSNFIFVFNGILILFIYIIYKGQSDWKDNEVLLLLSLCLEHIHLLSSNDKEFWRFVTAGMMEKGVYKTEVKCRNKYKNLKAQYTQNVDTNSNIGVHPTFIKFFDVSLI